MRHSAEWLLYELTAVLEHRPPALSMWQSPVGPDEPANGQCARRRVREARQIRGLGVQATRSASRGADHQYKGI